MQKDTAVCVTDRKEMLKTLIHHELLWLIDFPYENNVTAVTDWLLRLNEIYDNEGNLIHAYKKVCEIYED
jgi:hypothetical protein